MSEPSQTPLLASTWAELRRRKVVRVAIAYALVAWVVLQLGEITFEPLGLPPRALTWTILLAILGFPVALVLAWVFAVRQLAQAVDAGFSERWLFDADPRLQPLHAVPAYRQLRQRLAARIERERVASLAIATY